MDDGFARIQLRRKGKPSLWAVVDLADLDRLLEHRWRAHWGTNSWYAKAHIPIDGKIRTVYMHRFIMNVYDVMVVDHIDHDGLNNRRSNLRVVTQTQNMGNMISVRGTSRYKGVAWDKQTGRWMAQIRRDGRNFNLGRHDTEEEAARAYDRRARELYGECARLNFPVSDVA